ncbi:uncharacterized protein BT62DRAFT_1002505 [Guyanagaster necrorhizus]|uniref:DUF6534 domain-containing protein n=1 Tax=Guyanagaster necrorhizus TaxID=856835 RepID=A0A9P8AV53_9AGAR|nr:uncharacterized protein BT62DRAFT_1002505 [Guyanagaster necrorhizus MCA 3950]KAG7448955.1 hypothetical protein BT62DRAFT_1002505 [Guyanagaster necrorhizus MCA 3950]
MQPIPAGYPIEKLSGPLIVAPLLHWGLFGTLSVQLYLYYLAFPNDRQFTKYLVYGIYIVEFVQTMFVTHDTFATFGYGFGDMQALTDMHFNWLTVPIMSGVVACVGQVFYAYRIYILSKSPIVPILVTCVSLTSSVAAMITGAYSFQAGNVTELNNRRTTIAVGIWCGASAVCDIIIAICMTFYLMRGGTCFRRTRMLVTKLIRLTIETGSVTAVVALLNLILFLAFPHQTFYGTTALIIPKLYSNTVYMVLNSRIQILGGRDTYTSSSDMSITSTMIRDVSSPTTQDLRRTDGMQQRVPVVAITKEVFNADFGMGRINDKPQDKSRGYAS